MAIQPISRADYVSHVSFGDKHKKGKKDGKGHVTPAAKAIPIVVLMSMSPLTQCATAENYNSYNRQVASYPTTELVVNAPQEPKKQKLPDMQIVTINGESFRVWGVSRDDNPDDAETMLFKYEKDLGNNKVAVLAGQFLAISDTPREDGRYLMMYSSMDVNGKPSMKYEIAYLPEKFIAPPNSAAKSPANNNACGVETMATFEEWFGGKAVKNAPNLEDCTNFELTKKH